MATHLSAFRRRLEARRATTRASRDLAVAITEHRPQALNRVCPHCGAGPHWLGDLRRGRRSIWGGLLAFLDRAAALGAPAEVLLLLPDVLATYIRELYDGHPAPALRLAA